MNISTATPWPPNCEVLEWRKSPTGKMSAAVVVSRDGNILVSDTSFCAALSVIGVDALNDVPRSCAERMWWAYDLDDSSKVRELASSFYKQWEPPLIDLSFVRIALNRQKSFNEACKRKSANDHTLRPMTIRRLDAKGAI